MLTFLEVNGIRLQYSDADIVKIGLSVADGSISYEELLSWIIDHRINGI